MEDDMRMVLIEESVEARGRGRGRDVDSTETFSPQILINLQCNLLRLPIFLTLPTLGPNTSQFHRQNSDYKWTRRGHI